MSTDIIPLIQKIKMLGIHGNYECIRCGACCVYFHILGDRPEKGIFKIADQRCKYLSIDSEGVASCSVHEGERPEACRNFLCNISDLFPKDCVGLKRTSEELRRAALATR